MSLMLGFCIFKQTRGACLTTLWILCGCCHGREESYAAFSSECYRGALIDEARARGCGAGGHLGRWQSLAQEVSGAVVVPALKKHNGPMTFLRLCIVSEVSIVPVVSV